MVFSGDLIVLAFGLGGSVAAGWHLARRRRVAARAAHEFAGQLGELAPRSTIYPVVDRDRCIGSLSCLKACPEGELLTFRNGVPFLAHPDKCLGHGTCAAECPVDAIRLVIGTREKAVMLPELRAGHESSRAGIHVVGELAGAPLLEPSIAQGLAVGRLLATRLRRAPSSDLLDVAIVGAGPAGLATAFALHAAGHTYRILERGVTLSTVRSYPAGKVVSTRRLEPPAAGVLGKRRITREELIADWMRALRQGNICVQEHTEVLGIEGSDGALTLQTSRGPVQARKVVLATGRGGTPRPLEVQGEDLPKVVRQLANPGDHLGRRALVVGGGDTAVEAAIALARAGASDVVLCHRGERLARCNAGNRLEVEQLAGEGRVRLFLGSQLLRIGETTVWLGTPRGEIALGNDVVVLAIGGDLPVALLERAGVRLKRQAGEAPAVGPAPSRVSGAARAAATVALAFVPAALMLCLQLGWDYYRLDLVSRLRAPLHGTLRPSSPFGIAMGVVSAALMLVALAYAFRKRSKRLIGRGNIRDWLGAHSACGTLCLVTVAVHASFSATSAVASATWAALLGLAGTGAVGRFLYGRLRPVPDLREPVVRGGGAFLDGTGGTAVAVAVATTEGAAVLKLAFGAWRVLHLALAAFVVLAVVAHVLVAVLFGYAFR